MMWFDVFDFDMYINLKLDHLCPWQMDFDASEKPISHSW